MPFPGQDKEDGSGTETLTANCTIDSSSESEMILKYPFTSEQEQGLVLNMTPLTFTFKLRGGVASAPVQTVTGTGTLVE